MSTTVLRSLYAGCVIGAVVLAAACNTSSNSSSVAPLGLRTPSPAPTPTFTPTPLPTKKPTPSPTPTAMPSATPTPTGSPCLGSNQNTQPLSPSGGNLTLPDICTFSGTVGYATNDAPGGMTITFTTSVQNINGVPAPNGGTPVFYTRVEIGTKTGQQVKFNSGSQLATLASSTLIGADTYALCAYIGSFVIQDAPQIAGQPTGGVLSYPSPLTAQGLQATGGVLPTGVNIDTVVTQGVPSSCVPAQASLRR